ncbi:MAG: insulinase family protein [Myxococcales bacterium]|nr:insulinase family protein [Myxococcales bacterium]
MHASPPLPHASATKPASTTPDRATDKLEIPFEKYQLDNGLTVILHQDNRLPLVAVSVWYDVGALHERPGRSGFAHLFEHMMFQGSPHVGEDQHFKILEALGASQVNGTTSFDRTNYFETVPSNALETALWLESDRMGFLLESVTKKSLDNQIDVVKNERRQSTESRPYGLVRELIIQKLYPAPHPYHGNIIGSMKDIGSATLDDIREFFKTYYSPSNATLVLAGDIQITTATSLINKYFGPLQGRPKPTRPQPLRPTLAKAEEIIFDEPVGRLPKLSIVWPGPKAYHKDSAALDLLSHVISGTQSSRLDARVSYRDSIAQSVTAAYFETFAGGQFQIDLVVQPGRNIDEALTAVDEVIASLDSQPITQAELSRAKNAQETRMLFGLEQLGGFGGRTEQLQSYQYHFGDPGRFTWDINRYRGVTLDSLEQARRTWLSETRLIVKAIPSASSSPSPHAQATTHQAAAKKEGIR